MTVSELMSHTKLRSLAKKCDQIKRTTVCCSQYKETKDLVLQALERYVFLGANYGFRGKLDVRITELTEKTARLVDERNARKCQRLAEDIRMMMSETDDAIDHHYKELNEGRDSEMKNDVLNRIDTYTGAINVQLGLSTTLHKEVLEQNKELLQALRAAVEGCSDVTSNKAKKQHDVITEKLYAWAQKVAGNLHGMQSTLFLSEAVAEAQKWSALAPKNVSAVKKLFCKLLGKSAYAKLAENERYNAGDTLGLVSKSAVYKEAVDNLSEFLTRHVEEKGKVLEEMTNKSDIDLINAAKKEQAELQEAYRERFANGEIDEDELLELFEDSEREVEDLERDREDLRLDGLEAKEELRQLKSMERLVKIVVRVFEKYKNEPRHITRLGENMNIESLVGILMNDASMIRDPNVFDTFETIRQVIQDEAKAHFGTMWEDYEASRENRKAAYNERKNARVKEEEDPEKLAEKKRRIEEIMNKGKAARAAAQHADQNAAQRPLSSLYTEEAPADAPIINQPRATAGDGDL